MLQEFYVRATRPSRRDALAHEQAAALVEAWLRFPTQEISVELLRAGVSAARRYHVSYWDASVIEAARLQGCAVLLSEDLSHGQDFDGVRVENPFLQD